MGAAQSTNQVNSIINAGIEVVNTSVQNCFPVVSNSVEVQICADGTGNQVKIDKIDINQYAKLDSKCVQTAQATTEISQDVINSISQKAESVVESLSLGVADANNIINNSYSLSERIINAFTQNCSPKVNNSAQFQVCAKGTNNVIDVGYINATQGIDAISQCIFNSVSDSKAAQDIKQTIDQSATAKTEGLLNGLKWIGIILGAIVGIILLVVIIKAISGGKNKTEVTIAEGKSK